MDEFFETLTLVQTRKIAPLGRFFPAPEALSNHILPRLCDLTLCQATFFAGGLQPTLPPEI